MPRRNQYKPTIESQERARRVVEMRTAGYTFQQIADALGYADQSGAYRSYSRALKAIPAPAIEEHRRQLEQDLLAAKRALWPKIENGDVWAVQRLIDIWDRLSKLRGMDAPTRKQIEVVSQDWVDREIARLEAEIEGAGRTFPEQKQARAAIGPGQRPIDVDVASSTRTGEPLDARNERDVGSVDGGSDA